MYITCTQEISQCSMSILYLVTVRYQSVPWTLCLYLWDITVSQHHYVFFTYEISMFHGHYTYFTCKISQCPMSILYLTCTLASRNVHLNTVIIEYCESTSCLTSWIRTITLLGYSVPHTHWLSLQCSVSIICVNVSQYWLSIIMIHGHFFI